MKGFILFIIKGWLLVGAIYLIAYAVATPGSQTWQAIVGGICVGIYVALSELEVE